MELGALVSPGTPVFTIGDDSGFVVRTDVNPDLVGSLKIGQIATISKDSKTFTGNVSLLSPGSDATTRMFRVEFTLQDSAKAKEILHIGDFSDVFLTILKSDIKTLSIPFSALISDGQGGFIVYISGNDGMVTKKAVKVGAQNESRVEILNGISEGDRVVVSGALNLQDGDIVVEK